MHAISSTTQRCMASRPRYCHSCTDLSRFRYGMPTQNHNLSANLQHDTAPEVLGTIHKTHHNLHTPDTALPTTTQHEPCTDHPVRMPAWIWTGLIRGNGQDSFVAPDRTHSWHWTETFQSGLSLSLASNCSTTAWETVSRVRLGLGPGLGLELGLDWHN